MDDDRQSRARITRARLLGIIVVIAMVVAIGLSAGIPRKVAVAPPPFHSQATIGESVKGAEIVVHKFGTGDRRILYIANVHGDEYGTAVAQAFVDRLIDQPTLVPEGVEIHVVTCVNPDGLAAGTRANANGADINRNMPSSNWKPELDPRDTSGREGLNGGSAAGSEPETQALLSYMEQGFESVISLHSQGGLVDYDGPGAEELAREMATAAGLPAKHLGYQPYITGSMGQYVPAQFGIPIITLELQSEELSDSLMEALLVPTE